MTHYWAAADDGDEWQTCTICKMLIPIKRNPYHVVRCLKSHPEFKYWICLFNAQHIVPLAERRHHEVNCPDKGVIEKNLAQSVINVPCTFVDHAPDTSNECWDDEMTGEMFTMRQDMPKFAKPTIKAASQHMPPAPRNKPSSLQQGRGLIRPRRGEEGDAGAIFGSRQQQQRGGDYFSLPVADQVAALSLQAMSRGRGGYGRGTMAIGLAPEPMVGRHRAAADDNGSAGGRGRGVTTDQPQAPRPPTTLPQGLQAKPVAAPAVNLRGVGRGSLLVNNSGQQRIKESSSPAESASNSTARPNGLHSPGKRSAGRGKPRPEASGSSTASSSSTTSSTTSLARDSDVERDALKELRKLKKNLRGINEKELKMQREERLTPDEVEKVGKKASVERQIAAIVRLFPQLN